MSGFHRLLGLRYLGISQMFETASNAFYLVEIAFSELYLIVPAAYGRVALWGLGVYLALVFPEEFWQKPVLIGLNIIGHEEGWRKRCSSNEWPVT